MTIKCCDVIHQVIIGSPDLKANQSINQVVEVLPEAEKYRRFVKSLRHSTKYVNNQPGRFSSYFYIYHIFLMQVNKIARRSNGW